MDFTPTDNPYLLLGSSLEATDRCHHDWLGEKIERATSVVFLFLLLLLFLNSLNIL